MQDALLVLGLWLLFGGAHVGLAEERVRAALVSRFGELGFGWSFTLIASVLFALLAGGYSEVRASGPSGLALAAVPWARGPLFAMVVAGFALMIGALAPSGYWDSPAAILRDGVRPAYGLERITRHPFFTGLVLVTGAHALLATRLTGTIFFMGFVLLSTIGPLHQARKLRARKGEPFAQYLKSTSAVPFVAILRGRQQLVLREIPWAALGLGVALAFGVRHGHEAIFAWYGAPLTAAVVGGSILIGAVSTLRRTRG